MNKKQLMVALVIGILVFSVCYAEQDKPVILTFIPEEMNSSVEFTKDHIDAIWSATFYRKPYYTYSDSIFKGVAYFSDPDRNGNFGLTFYLSNQSKTSIDVAKNSYRGVDKDGNIFRFEFLEVINNEGIVNSSIVNPEQEILFRCIAPFKFLYDMQNIEEVYIKLRNKRIFFVPEDKISEYQKIENRILRHLRNLWWNIK